MHNYINSILRRLITNFLYVSNEQFIPILSINKLYNFGPSTSMDFLYIELYWTNVYYGWPKDIWINIRHYPYHSLTYKEMEYHSKCITE